MYDDGMQKRTQSFYEDSSVFAFQVELQATEPSFNFREENQHDKLKFHLVCNNAHPM